MSVAHCAGGYCNAVISRDKGESNGGTKLVNRFHGVVRLHSGSRMHCTYTYYGDGACGPMSVSGRFADQSGCSDCAATAPCSGTAPTPNGIIKNALTCGSGCGEIYWGEWISDPPDKCDACDQDGNWIGPHCCPPSGWSRFWAGLHGQRMAGDTTGCASCGGLDGDTSQGVQIDGLAIEVPSGGEQNGPIVLDPTNLAAEPTDAAPAQLAERPSEYHPQSRLVRRVRR